MIDGMLTKVSESGLELKVKKPKDEEKQGENTATVSGYITTYGNVDVVGDVIQQGALDNYIERFNNEGLLLRMLFQHQRESIIGRWTELRSDDYGVYATGEIYTDVTLGADTAALIRRGALDSFSIGFAVNDYEVREDGGRVFTDIELVETSVVDVPANPRAQLDSIKLADGSINIRVLEKTLRDAGFSTIEAKVGACLLYTSPSPRDRQKSRMPSSA